MIGSPASRARLAPAFSTIDPRRPLRPRRPLHPLHPLHPLQIPLAHRLRIAPGSRRDRRAGTVIVAFGALLALAPTAPAWTAALAPPAAAAAAAAPAAKGLTLQEVLAKSVAARGGLQKLHAVKTRRESGTLELGPGNAWPLTIEHKRPNRMRMEISLQGTQLIRVYDGAHGWQKQPQKQAPEELTGDDLHNIANEADFDNVLVDTAGKGKAVLLGTEPVPAGTGGMAGGAAHDAYRVQVTLAAGDVFVYLIDGESFLPIRWEGGRLINGKQVTFVSDFKDYREVDGVRYAFLIVSSIKGSAQNQKITFTKIEPNVPIDDARFTPATMVPPPTPAPAVPTLPGMPGAVPPGAGAPGTVPHGAMPQGAAPAPAPPLTAVPPPPPPPTTQPPPPATNPPPPRG